MSDDNSLFASKNAIGRKWYYLNILILFLITFVTVYLFKLYIIPNVISDFWNLITICILYFALIMYVITFLSLIDRRLYDVFGSRESTVYRIISYIIWITILLKIFLFYCRWKGIVLPVYNEQIYFISKIFDTIFVCIVLFAGFIKGKISTLSYDEYKRKIKYQ